MLIRDTPLGTYRSSDVNNILGKQTPRSCQKKRED